jgi:hypothetical protein
MNGFISFIPNMNGLIIPAAMGLYIFGIGPGVATIRLGVVGVEVARAVSVLGVEVAFFLIEASALKRGNPRGGAS